MYIIRFVVFICLFFSALASSSCSDASDYSNNRYNDIFTEDNLKHNYKQYGHIAHALGSIDSKNYTNSREAFELSYSKGFKIFEVDLVLLKDGTVFCAHDNHENKFGLNKPFRQTTIDELSGKLYLAKYTPMTGSQLLSLLDKYEDVYIILDTKYNHIDIVDAIVEEAEKNYPSVLDRVIPHISGLQNYPGIKRVLPSRLGEILYNIADQLERGVPGILDKLTLGILSNDLNKIERIYPFNSYILALYRNSFSDAEVLEFVRSNNIKAVMMTNGRYSSEFKSALNEAGAVVYVHTINDLQKINQFKEQGVGVYTDSCHP